MRLAGKRAVIIGGTGGLGQSIVEYFLKEGARVVSASRSSGVAPIDADETVSMVTDRVDVRDPGSVTELLSRTVERWGGVDILVTAAGIMNNKTVGRLDDVAVSEMVATNICGTITCVNAAARIMGQAGGGSILTVSSAVSSVRFQGTAVYAATKAAVEAFTRTAALDLAKRHVRINCISPGFIAAGLAKDLLEHVDFGPQILDRISLGHAGEPEDVASSAAFLVSDEAAYITGTVLTVDGGLR
jgi:NAD(P)-dependent dehydrogenase (short-subunit alcohol dehydrogenase family)